MSGADVVFVCSVDQVEWPMFGADERALSSLTAGYCPLCPNEQLRESSDGSQCACCGSTWRWSPEEVTLLPGPRVSMQQVS